MPPLTSPLPFWGISFPETRSYGSYILAIVLLKMFLCEQDTWHSVLSFFLINWHTSGWNFRISLPGLGKTEAPACLWNVTVWGKACGLVWADNKAGKKAQLNLPAVQSYNFHYGYQWCFSWNSISGQWFILTYFPVPKTLQLKETLSYKKVGCNQGSQWQNSQWIQWHWKKYLSISICLY